MNTPKLQQSLKTLEDPLAHLPCSVIRDYRKGEVFYSLEQPSAHLYLVTEGLIKVSRTGDREGCTVLDLYQSDNFFGESALIGSHGDCETAVATVPSQVMIWTVAQIEELIANRPLLGIALIQLFVQRSQDFGRRIESFSVDLVPRRLTRALLRFSERTGPQSENGSVTMPALTHEFLAQYVGTSREIVTNYMNQFRRYGYLEYSRKSITLHREIKCLLKDEAVERKMAA